MAFSAEDIVERIMAKTVRDLSASVNPLKRWHVSQTADQLPDIRIRNSWYRAELLRQIEEKREMERKRKELEQEEEERLARKIEAEREKLRREFLEEQEKKALQIEEAKRKQAIIAARLEEIRLEAEKKREEEALRKKNMYFDYLYNQHVSKSNYYKPRGWNSEDYVRSALNLHLDEIYKTAPLHMLADVYKQLESEKVKMRDIIRRRISEGEE